MLGGNVQPDFNKVEFDLVRSASGVNSFIISSKEWVDRTNAIGILAKTGRYGSGTFAHEEIAMEFATWLSPQFRLYVLKEFKRLKETEAQRDDPAWTIRRILTKANYQVHTDAVREIILPAWNLPPEKEAIAYADEAEVLNRAVFELTSQEWRKQNPSLSKNGNIRDNANIVQLTIPSNLESLNATFMREGLNKQERFFRLSEAARQQYDSLTKSKVLAAQGKALTKGLTPLDAPKAQTHEKPPATGVELKQGFSEMKKRIANAQIPPKAQK